MGLVPRFSKADIKKVIEAKKRQFRQAVVNRLETVGLQFVKMAREKTAAQGGFNDVTGNLRSSIGFAIVDHGNIVKDNYEASKRGQQKTEGIQEAKKKMQTLVLNFTEGYALVVVAGMGYAAAVESRGRDVITGSSLEAEDLLKRAIAELKRKA